MLGLTSLLAGSDSWRLLDKCLASTQGNLLLSGVSGATKSVLAASWVEEHAAPLLYVTATPGQADQVHRDLQALLPTVEVHYFPARENPLYGITALSPELVGERLKTLYALSEGRQVIVVAPWEALFYRLPAPSRLAGHTLELSYGQIVALEHVARTLVQTGYERVDMVERPGQFSQRGGILDIYGLTSDWPVRVEFFGDEIDLIKQFDLTSQRSLENMESAVIMPAQECFWDAQVADAGIARIEAELKEAVRSSHNKGQQREHVLDDLERIKQGLVFPGRERYLPYFDEERFGLLDYMPQNALVVVDEPSRVYEQAEADYRHFTETFTNLLQEGRCLPRQLQIAFSPDELVLRLSERSVLHLALFPRRPAPWRIEQHIPFLSRAVPSFHGQMGFLRQEAGRLLDNKYRLVILAGDQERQQHIMQYLQGEAIDKVVALSPEKPPVPGEISITIGELHTGFELPDIKLYVLTEGDILNKTRRRRGRQLSRAEGARLSDYRDLSVGDYVVHVHHGIGQYLGMKTLEIAGQHRDYLHVKYAGNDSLYVPTEQINLLQKYVGPEGKAPKVYSLGGADWQKVKSRVKQSVQEMAKKLLALYATRDQNPGLPFPEDNEWQQQMEGNFPYTETEDQLRAIAAIKQDMQSDKVMDRLLCGDVGYGKTEVAVRAAFKAATAGKQVSVLVPTTILAQQHYSTFRERFSGFPVEVSLMSRFRSAAENQETARRVSQGLVDVVIGTHRLLQKDVKFRDLGLLVIDEEQRFGVAHKEKLKLLKENVDTLTLTATPIPRTLHMAMVGMRDMSVIETPPEDRFPVQTYVVEANDEIVQNAIRRELARNGQIYYLHNRVRSIRYVADRLAKLVPEARIAVGHGQMGEEKLERLMLDFMDGEYDVLVSTTIIESGLDIPNVNTIIVEDADKFGLAQLYQLRGRVGRSNRIAYAYFTYKPDKALSEVADKRLQAIKEFTELGSGFKIAMRDLEIRGAGNILGPEQSGFMVAVGFDLYCQLLEEAVRELKGQPVKEELEPELQIPLDAYIPDRYIKDSKQKVEMYKKLRAAIMLDDVDELEDEMLDRFGPMPESVQNLLLVARMRVISIRLRIMHLSITEKQLVMRMASDAFLGPEHIELLYRETAGRFRLQPGKAGVFHWPLLNATAATAARNWMSLMMQIVEREQKEEEIHG